VIFADLEGSSRLGSDGAGAPGRPAERIGMSTAHRLLQDLGTGATLDRYACDQSRLLFGLATARLDGRQLSIDGQKSAW
jgi:RNA 3'-terminal phosphate cyclase